MESLADDICRTCDSDMMHQFNSYTWHKSKCRSFAVKIFVIYNICIRRAYTKTYKRIYSLSLPEVVISCNSENEAAIILMIFPSISIEIPFSNA